MAGLIVSFSPIDYAPVPFVRSIARLDKMGADYEHLTRSPIPKARNGAVKMALERGAEWLVQIDDDMVFPADAVKRLLAHDVDVVCALAYARRAPYAARAWSVLPGDPLRGMVWEGLEHSGLREVDISGFAVSLIRRGVLEKLREKPFGSFDVESEDFWFCKVLREMEVKVWVDTEMIVGHLGEGVVVDEEFKKKQKP